MQTAWAQEYKISRFLPEDLDLDALQGHIFPVAEPKSFLLADIDFELLQDEGSESRHVFVVDCQPEAVGRTVVVVYGPQRYVFLVAPCPSTFYLSSLLITFR